MQFDSMLEAQNWLKSQRIRFTDDKVILIKGDHGLKTWSAIDYLCNYGKYVWRRE